MNDEQVVKQLVRLIKPMKPKKVIWFGSKTRGQGHADSDVDLCVVLPRPINAEDRGKLLLMLHDGGYDWHVEPDFFLISSDRYQQRMADNDFFIREVNKGRVVYG